MELADPEGANILVQLLFLMLLVLVNAFFSGAEMAIVSVNKSKIKNLAKEGNKKAALIQSLLQDSTKFLSTIQVAITLAGFFSSASAATGISKVLENRLAMLHVPYSGTIAVVIITILLSYVTLVLGELVPKRVALQRAEQFSLLAVGPIYGILKLLSPFIRLLSMSTNGILRLFGMKTENLEEVITEEEIKAMLESGSENGVFNEIEKEMINSIFSFDDKLAREIMVPRREVFAIDIQEEFGNQIDDILDAKHTRIPVYDGEIDNIIGILHMNDLLVEMRKTAYADMNLHKMIREPYCVPESKNTDELFRELQRTRNGMAILIDEYGGFSGIVTVEDLVEEIVGELNDEDDTVVEAIQQIDDTTYLLDGGVLVEDINDRLHLALQVENYDTLSGFLIEKLDFIPKNADLPPICVDGAEFKVLEIGDKRITKIQLKIL